MSKPKVIMTMLGAASDDVTGSCELLRIESGKKIYFGLIDAGIFQGGENDEKNFRCPIKADKLDFIIITHAHADHLGALPMLRGFNGKIYATASTIKQGKEIMLNAAVNYEKCAADKYGISYLDFKSMCDELEHASEKKVKDIEYYNDLKDVLDEIKQSALYTVNDVENISKHFCSVIPYSNFIIAPGVYARLVPTTHINGATSVELYVGEYDENSVNISFSGDIGPKDSFLYKSHKYGENRFINYAIMESLHGIEEKSQTPKDAYNELKNIIFKGIAANKTIILAGFALDRTAILLYAINRMIEEYDLSADVYFDSPLAYREFLHYVADYNTKNSYWFKDLGKKPFDINEIIITNKYNEHMRALLDRDAKVVITASAFGEGGRIVDYFEHYIQDDDAIFVFAGWISPECTSSILVAAQKGDIVEIHGNNYVKHCETYKISGFSAHGYYPDFIDYIEQFPCLKGLFLNHAERETKIELAEELRKKYNFDIQIPEAYDNEENSFYEMTAERMNELLPIEGFNKFKSVLKGFE